MVLHIDIVIRKGAHGNFASKRSLFMFLLHKNLYNVLNLQYYSVMCLIPMYLPAFLHNVAFTTKYIFAVSRRLCNRALHLLPIHTQHPYQHHIIPTKVHEQHVKCKLFLEHFCSSSNNTEINTSSYVP